MSIQFIFAIFTVKFDNFPMKNYDIFSFFALNIDCDRLSEAVLRSTHNLCFRAKIRELELMFMKHYAPNRCLYINVAKLRTGVGSAEMSHLQIAVSKYI